MYNNKKIFLTWSYEAKFPAISVEQNYKNDFCRRKKILKNLPLAYEQVVYVALKATRQSLFSFPNTVSRLLISLDV